MTGGHVYGATVVSQACHTHLGNVLIIQPPRLGKELEPVAMTGQVACRDHDGSIVHVAPSHAGLRVPLFIQRYICCFCGYCPDS